MRIDNFNPQGSREPRLQWHGSCCHESWYFNPQGSREPRQDCERHSGKTVQFQSTRLSRTSTITNFIKRINYRNFNPQGSREPRQAPAVLPGVRCRFQSTRLSRTSTANTYIILILILYFLSTLNKYIH